jgi:cell division initiation protein
MFIAPAEVQERKLKRRLRGYSRVDVEKLLQEVVVSYAQVWRERDELRARLELVENELAPLRESERHLTDSLVTAERAAAKIRAQAALDAEELLNEARSRSEAQQSGAKAQSTQLKNEIDRLEIVKRELSASIRAVLLAGLELVEDRDATKSIPLVELSPSTHETPDHATA